jgi:hypothetical protein
VISDPAAPFGDITVADLLDWFALHTRQRPLPAVVARAGIGTGHVADRPSSRIVALAGRAALLRAEQDNDRRSAKVAIAVRDGRDGWGRLVSTVRHP